MLRASTAPPWTEGAALPRPPATSRDALVAVARQLLAAGGERALSTRALSREAGVSAGTPYRYFTDKDALLLAVARAVEAEFVADLHLAAPAAFPLVPALPGIARTMVKRAHQTPELAHLLTLPPHLSPALQGEGVTAWIRWRVTVAQRTGEVGGAEPGLVANAAFGMVRGVLAGATDTDPRAQQQVIADGLAGLLRVPGEVASDQQPTPWCQPPT